MADNYVDKLKIGGVDRPIQDTTSGFYTKPSTGIPSTDLSSDVQTSLGKADTALQSFTETDPTVPEWAKAATRPNYAYGEIGYEIATQTTSGAVTIDGTKPLHIITLSGAATSVAFSSGYLPPVGHSCHIIFTAATATTVSLAHTATGSVRYICPAGESPDDIDVPAGGYAEIDLLRGVDTEESSNTVSWIYVRGI